MIPAAHLREIDGRAVWWSGGGLFYHPAQAGGMASYRWQPLQTEQRCLLYNWSITPFNRKNLKSALITSSP